MENPLEKLKNEVRDHPTTLDVVSSLMNDDNIEMKTEITNPYALDVMMVIAKYFRDCNMEEIAELLELWKELLLKYMVSNKRMSRIELVEILKGYFSLEREKEKQVSLSSNLAKMNQQSIF
ncbi:MAG: hypothetical protein ACFFAO_02165 [Candidatus Hermodarchaeota archaeon]